MELFRKLASKGFEKWGGSATQLRKASKETKQKKMKKMTMMLIRKKLWCLYRLAFLSIFSKAVTVAPTRRKRRRRRRERRTIPTSYTKKKAKEKNNSIKKMF